jgi:MFS family permease
LPNRFRALRHRNYRVYFAGQICSLIGTWVQFVAMNWLIYRMTGSPALLGLTAFINQIPILLLGPFAGVVADRVNRRRLLLTTQTLAMVQAFTLAYLAFTGHIQPWHVIVLAGLLGIVNAFDVPGRQSFIVQMLGDKKDLPNAIALNSLTMNTTRLVGPSIGGFLVMGLGEAWCFLLNGFSFLAILAALSSARIHSSGITRKTHSAWRDLREGFHYTFGFMPIRALLLQLSVISFVAMPYTILMPVFAGGVFGGTARTFGTLIGCAGFGAIIATLYLASRRNVKGLASVIAIAPIICGIALMLFSQSRILWLSHILMMFVGFGIISHAASINTILQSVVDEDKRGRVMSFYTMCFVGTAPIGSLVLGQIAHRIGAPTTFLLAGACCVLAGIMFYSRLETWRRNISASPALHGIIP